MTPYLFVYGTLRKGVVNKVTAMLGRCARYAGPARVQGRLYRVAHYPGLVLTSRGDGFVRGDVYAIDHAAAMFRILDAYEGRLFLILPPLNPISRVCYGETFGVASKRLVSRR